MSDAGWASPAIEKRYRQFMADNWGEVDIPRLCEVMWNTGAREALASSREFSGMSRSLQHIEADVRRLRALWESFGSDCINEEFESVQPSSYWETKT